METRINVNEFESENESVGLLIITNVLQFESTVFRFIHVRECLSVQRDLQISYNLT